MSRKIYVASSWRNKYYTEVVKILLENKHEVYDFRNPPNKTHGFFWAEIEQSWEDWTAEQFVQNLEHPLAQEAFKSDFEAMQWADTCVMVMPCGRSAHLEAGYFIGAGKDCFILLTKGRPELMYKMTTFCLDIDDLLTKLQ